jgi:hypothetical protein
MRSRGLARAAEHAQVGPEDWPVADELLDDSLDQTLLRMMLSGQTGRIARVAAANHCIYAAQLAELALSGQLLDRDGRPLRAGGAPARAGYLFECLPRRLAWESWDELFFQQLHQGEGERLAAWVDEGTWRHQQLPQQRDLRRTALRALLRLYRGDPEGAVLAVGDEIEAGFDAASAEHRAAAAVIRGASGALTLRSNRWLVPEFSGGAAGC